MSTEKGMDFYIRDQLIAADIDAEYQESSNLEIKEALKSASKKQNGNAGRPEFISVIGDYVLVIEDKDDINKQLLLDEDDYFDLSPHATQFYALNGAVWYALKIVEQTSYKKVFAVGASGNEKHHIITPYFVDGSGWLPLDDIDGFTNFNRRYIDDYYHYQVLGETPDEELQLEEIIRHAKTLHEYLRDFGGLGENEKPLVVSAVLLALQDPSFDLSQLKGDAVKTDGQIIYDALSNHLKRIKVTPDTKREKILNQFLLIKDRTALNENRGDLGKTPLKFYAEFLEKNILKALQANVSEDILGRFYSEFMSYSGGDAQSLGVVLTPHHVTELFCDLLDVKPDEVVFDPCAGTAGFLISAMCRMLNQTEDSAEIEHIKREQIHGIEIREDMFAIATTNMILRGDGKSNLRCADFLKEDSKELQISVAANVGMMNPPYSLAKNKETEHLSEIHFVEHLLNSLVVGGKAAVIVPLSTATGKTATDKKVKKSILKNHTLEGVITCNRDTFGRIGTDPCIMIFTAHMPHPKDKEAIFVNFEDDGYEIKKHIGLVETERAKERRQHLLECWFGRIEPESKFMVKSTVEATDEWLHSFYYFNDEIPSEDDFMKSIADYLTFEFDMVAHGRGYLFKEITNA